MYVCARLERVRVVIQGVHEALRSSRKVWRTAVTVVLRMVVIVIKPLAKMSMSLKKICESKLD